MTGRGPEKAATIDEVYDHLDQSERPVWTAKDVADRFDVSRPTATDRLGELHEKELVDTIKVGNATAYFIPDAESLDLLEEHRQSIMREFEDKFVGLPTAPWTAVHPKDGPAKAGDKIQIRVEGVPGNWSWSGAKLWSDRRSGLVDGETVPDETQALISGELEAKPTTPIEHTDYPDDYDLEGNIGAEIIESEKGTATLASGVKNYLIRPRNDAVFLNDISIDWISPKQDSQEGEVYEGGEEPGL
jgi:hypothetical protein